MNFSRIFGSVLCRRFSRYLRNICVVEAMSEVPAEIGHNAYIVRRGDRDIWAVFECPCERGHRLTLNLSRWKTPYWKCRITKAGLSIWPSVWLDYECRSHFWIANNRVYWAHGVARRD